MASRIASIALVLPVLACLLRAQTVVIGPDGQPVVIQDGVPVPDPTPDGSGKPAGAKASPRQQKLQTLEFDRRPSAILKAWANPPKPAEEPPADAPKPPGEEAAKAEIPGESPDPGTAPDPDAEKKKAEAEATRKKAEEEAAKKAAEAKAIDEEMAALRRSVTLGDWAAVKSYLATLTKEEGKAGYEKMLQSLQTGPKAKPNVQPQFQQWQEKNRFAAEDVLGLCLAAPRELEKGPLGTLGQILRQALDAGVLLETFVDRVRPRLGEEGFPLDRRRLARMLAGANEVVAMGEFLPEPEAAEKENDRDGLNLLARSFLAKHEKDKKVEWLEKAWTVTQAALAAGDVKEDDKNEALKQAVDLAPRIRKDLGSAWLDESFTARPERGMEILAAIGAASSLGLQTDPLKAERRQKLLELQATAAKALLRAAPERAAAWRSTLELLATNWLREALFTYQFDMSTSRSPRMQRDVYGNFFFWDPSQGPRGGMPGAIKTSEILDARPDDAWLDQVEAALRPKFDMIYAQLLLKVEEEAEAFPYIEKLAASHPRPAKDLVDEFLRVWAKNHDPNSERNRSNQYVFFYGFEERANGIPLTRSKQERNLQDLGTCVARLRKLPVELDEKLLAQAFTKAHSVAEVYRLEVIEQVFGPISGLAPATLAELVEGMRANLAGLWRDPSVQEKNKTKRRQQDIQAEVLRGYELAHATLDRALQDHPESWELVLADAAIRHDENNYAWALRKDPDFSANRAAAFEVFHKAAALYAARAADLEPEKETTKAFEAWFYAALGACDLAALTHEQHLAAREIPLIREAIAALPGPRAERHLALFANTLFTRMGTVKPAAKFRYVREGLAIAGDHPQAREARDVFTYYRDLVTEIRLNARIDGGDRVGHETPFGVFMDIRHTREIERESGGFSKYLQNQNAQSFGWNYGRPLEDYRDKFEEAARTALQEHFDVLSVTFNDPGVRSRAAEPYGWRVTPYAYLLLKAKRPEVDRVPPLRLDLDFLDTSGYAVLPVESPVIPIDATAAAGDERPYENLKLTQTLDERQSKDGKLLLEVKASALGLPPALSAILELTAAGFTVAKTEDSGVSVVKFDEADDATRVTADRTWTVTLTAEAARSAPPETFAFGTPRLDVASDEHFRYVDADLQAVGATVSLERKYGGPDRAWLWWIPAAALVLAAGFVGFRWRRAPKGRSVVRFPLPEHFTPFTVLGLLRDIERRDGLGPDHRAELSAEISRIESWYFASKLGDAPDLAGIAQTWSSRAS